MPQIEKVTHDVGPDSTHFIASDYGGVFKDEKCNLAIYGFYSEEIAKSLVSSHDVGLWKPKQIKTPPNE